MLGLRNAMNCSWGFAAYNFIWPGWWVFGLVARFGSCDMATRKAKFIFMLMAFGAGQRHARLVKGKARGTCICVFFSSILFFFSLFSVKGFHLTVKSRNAPANSTSCWRIAVPWHPARIRTREKKTAVFGLKYAEPRGMELPENYDRAPDSLPNRAPNQKQAGWHWWLVSRSLRSGVWVIFAWTL